MGFDCRDAQMDREDPQREMWITSTALSTALNTAYFAESGRSRTASGAREPSPCPLQADKLSV